MDVTRKMKILQLPYSIFSYAGYTAMKHHFTNEY